jgi:type IV pilus assembly protein PilC
MTAPFWQRDIIEFIPFLQIKNKIPHGELAVFCRKLSFLLAAGVPVKNAVHMVAAQSPGRVFKGKLNDVRVYINRGDSFSNALAVTGLFPAFLYGLVAVGELTARLPAVMGQLAEYYEQQSKTEDELKAAMVYPAAVTTMMLAVMGMAVVYVLPNFGRVFAASQVPLPVLTQILFDLSESLIRHPFRVLAAILAGVTGFVLFVKSEAGDRCRLYFPLYKQTINLRFTQAMSLLLSSGQSLTAAIPACSQVLGNKKAQKDMDAVASGLREGQPFWETLSRVGYMDSLLVGMIQVGEETGSLPQTMEKCRLYFDQAYRQRLSRTGKLIEPAITIGLGVLLGLVMLAIILPTFTLMDIT